MCNQHNFMLTITGKKKLVCMFKSSCMYLYNVYIELGYIDTGNGHAIYNEQLIFFLYKRFEPFTQPHWVCKLQITWMRRHRMNSFYDDWKFSIPTTRIQIVSVINWNVETFRRCTLFLWFPKIIRMQKRNIKLKCIHTTDK